MVLKSRFLPVVYRVMRTPVVWKSYSVESLMEWNGGVWAGFPSESAPFSLRNRVSLVSPCFSLRNHLVFPQKIVSSVFPSEKTRMTRTDKEDKDMTKRTRKTRTWPKGQGRQG